MVRQGKQNHMYSQMPGSEHSCAIDVALMTLGIYYACWLKMVSGNHFWWCYMKTNPIIIIDAGKVKSYNSSHYTMELHQSFNGWEWDELHEYHFWEYEDFDEHTVQLVEIWNFLSSQSRANLENCSKCVCNTSYFHKHFGVFRVMGT